MPGAGARDLEVADRALGVDSGEGEVTDFGGCVGEAVEGGRFARRGFADEGDEWVAGHCEVVARGIV